MQLIPFARAMSHFDVLHACTCVLLRLLRDPCTSSCSSSNSSPGWRQRQLSNLPTTMMSACRSAVLWPDAVVAIPVPAVVCKPTAGPVICISLNFDEQRHILPSACTTNSCYQFYVCRCASAERHGPPADEFAPASLTCLHLYLCSTGDGDDEKARGARARNGAAAARAQRLGKRNHRLNSSATLGGDVAPARGGGRGRSGGVGAAGGRGGDVRCTLPRMCTPSVTCKLRTRSSDRPGHS